MKMKKSFVKAKRTVTFAPPNKNGKQQIVRGVAQPGSVSVWGAGGRKFKSCHPDS